MTPWQATSAAVERINEFGRRSSWRRRKSHEPYRECKPAAVSYSSFWNGGANSGGAVHPTDSRVRTADRRSNGGGPGRASSQSFCRDTEGWNGLHCGAPVGNGHGDPYLVATSAGGRT